MAIELIAEVASNHGGDLELAKAFIWAAAEAGADWVKFQSYQVRTLRPGDPQRGWLAHAELSDDAHTVLIEECRRAQTKFLTTIFHHSRATFLRQILRLTTLKIGHGESEEPTLRQAVQETPRLILSSSSMEAWPPTPSRPGEEDWLRVVGRYPAPWWQCGQDPAWYRWDRWRGWSDHAVGIHSAQQAITAGAQIIEKHVWLPGQTRPVRPWECSMADFNELRAFADADPAHALGRWQHEEHP